LTEKQEEGRPKAGRSQNAAEAEASHLMSEGWICILAPHTRDNGIGSILADQLFPQQQ